MNKANTSQPTVLLLNSLVGEDAVDVEVLRGGKPLVTQRVQFSSDRSQALLETVIAVCRDAGVEVPQLDGVLVVQGAQRFTVSRLAVVTANALTFGAGIPVVGCASRPSGDEVPQLLSSVNTAPIETVYAAAPTMTM